MYLIANFKAHQVDMGPYIRRLESLPKTEMEIILSPPSLYLQMGANSRFSTAAQDVSSYPEGPFTGETPASVLKASGADFVLIGHSERRHLFNEDSPLLKKKFTNCVEAQLHPILCVGETLEEHTTGNYLEKIRKQIEDVYVASPFPPLFAYEPVWAIGSGKIPSMESIEEVVQLIRETVDGAKVLYGGSVNVENAKKIGAITDGLLVGSASKNVETFIQIIQQLETL
ncbi:MAG: triose-phosphate isomerase [Chlamydiia bacterium]